MTGDQGAGPVTLHDVVVRAVRRPPLATDPAGTPGNGRSPGSGSAAGIETALARLLNHRGARGGS